MPKWFSLAIPIIVPVIAFAAFHPALSAEFVNFDDGKLFTDNEGYQGLSARHLEWMFTTTYMGHYQPLTWLSHAVDFKISGENPASFHRNNLILHALNTVLVYFVALWLMGVAMMRGEGDAVRSSARAEARGSPSSTRAKARGSRALAKRARTDARASQSNTPDSWLDGHPLALRLAAGVAALLFAVHPLRVESVAWASERRDVLSTFFLLAAALAFLRSVRPGEVRLRSWPWYAASILLLICSLLSKAWGMSFFVMVILLNVYPLARLPWRIRTWLDHRYGPIWLQTLPFFFLGVLTAVKAAEAQHSAFETMKTLDEWSLVDRITQAFYGLAFYLRKTVWPTDLAVLYELPRELNPFAVKYLLSALGVIAGAVALWTWRRRVPALVIAGVAYVVWLAPVLGFAQSGPQLVADRYSYVGCVGWAIVIGGALLLVWRRRPTVTCYSLSGLLVLAALAGLFTATVRQTHVWRSSETLWAHAVAVGADSTIAHRNHAIALRRRGEVEGTILHLRKAIELDPTDGSAWYLLANALRSAGQFAVAEEAYRQAIGHLLQKHLAYMNLGEMYLDDLDRVDDALEALRAGIAYRASLKTTRPAPAPGLLLYLGIALRTKGDFAGAQEALEAATRFKSTRVRATEELRLIGVDAISE